jgi:hypothetical protein
LSKDANELFASLRLDVLADQFKIDLDAEAQIARDTILQERNAEYKFTYSVIMDFDTEQDQREAANAAESEGIRCRLSIS